jgi:MFS transporter, ACS family, hexuronate transporter
MSDGEATSNSSGDSPKVVSAPTTVTRPAPADSVHTDPSRAWVWAVCVLLLLASTINYLDRQTLGNTSLRIKQQFSLTNEQYGALENGFGWAFAAGALIFGLIADRTNIRWLYPSVVAAWSLMAFLTGWATTFAGLWWCRTLLGFFESGHWPCALRTTQRLLPRENRALGNSVLQSGTAIGAILAPLILQWLLTPDVGSWRPAFQIMAAVGSVWIVGWLLLVRGDELRPVASAAGEPSVWRDLWAAVFNRRFIALLVTVILINACYQLLRVWLQIVVQEGRGWTEPGYLRFAMWFYVFNDVGCLGAGVLTAVLATRGLTVSVSRLLIFTVCGLLTSLTVLVPWLTNDAAFVAVMLLVSMGALGLFPCYYALSQELSTRNQGAVTGLLGTMAWLTTSPLQPLFGRYLDQTGRHDLGLAVVGLAPLLAAGVLWACWPRDASP